MRMRSLRHALAPAAAAAALAFLCCAAAASPARAQVPLDGGLPLAPGGPAVVPPPETTPLGTLLATRTAGFIGSPGGRSLSVALRQAVYQDADGTLDFVYQFENRENSPNHIDQAVMSAFTGYATSVSFYAADPDGSGFFTDGSEAPSTAQRPSASQVAFNFAGAGLVAPGETSDVLVISTNATAFGETSLQIFQVSPQGTPDVGGVSNFFRPIGEPVAAATPAPPGLVVAGIGGLVALAGFRRRRGSRA